MILLYAGLFALGLAIVGLIVGTIFHVRGGWLQKVVAVCAVLTFLLALIGGCCYGVSASAQRELRAEYNDLMTYYNVVNYSDDEYVRFDYYNKILEYNKQYETLSARYENPWISWFQPKDGLYGISFIDFMLNRGSYDGGYG